MRLLLGLCFLGVLMVWVLAPTNLWRNNWLLNIRTRTDSKYFGTQCANMLIYTFPILFIAALGCVYLHLGKKGGNYTESSKSHRLASWKRPVIVKGPLGVVSAMELAFISMFIALLIWSFSTYLTVSFSKINKGISHSHDKKWERKLRSTGFYLGFLGNICCAFLFFPVARGPSILPLLGLTSEGSIKYHIWLGHMAMTFFTAHGLLFLVYWALTNNMAQILKWDNTGVSNVAGELALVFGITMWLMAFPRIRRRAFELFFYTHQLYIIFLFFYVLHVGIQFFCIILSGVYLFLIDRYLRFLQSRKRVRLVSARLLPCETVELNFSKSPGLFYNPTSIMFINIPILSSFQWHPFTVSSNCNMEPEKLSVIIKSGGNWSQKLYQTLSSPAPIDHLNVSIEGPYGPTADNFFRHEALVMVSGGSGITPFISIIRELIFRSTMSGCPIPRVHLICAFKNYVDVTILDLLLPITGTHSDISRIQLKLEVFVTREKVRATMDTQKLLRTIWFKPSPSDAPISMVLGPNDWLWLGIIISTSFAMFLILLGILTHYYIYPIDHNTNNVYSYLAKALLNMLFICISIVVTASAVTLWKKKQNDMAGKQIQNMDVATPTTSPSSWFYNADREIESLPHHSLTQNSKVHFGARPNLKRMLLECEGSNIGVLVSGPKEMRHEVATICSSGLVNNLHFEAISFNW
ncbi:ferric reduction oxidase 2-like isoform X2 [Tasmannia lanceolata]|uniref:ferric reduction oxidase 2-like isoform X2 n=1 Tax=Tasmannia lanceolata TaxID=3420 RepID=UPI0040627DA4